MQIKEIMTCDPEHISPDTSLAKAAQMMRDHGYGFIPVDYHDKLIGMVTDRDMVIRGVANGGDPQRMTVADVMTKKVLYCYEDQNINEVAENMRQQQVHRLIVLNRDKRLVGIVSLGDLSVKGKDDKLCGKVLHGISEEMH